MSFVVLGVSLALVAYAGAIVLGTVLVAPLWVRACRISQPAARARWLAALRFLPLTGAFLLAGGVVLPSFVWFEPRDTVERVSVAMAAAAGAGLLILLAGPARGLMSLLSTRRLSKRWNRGARSIEVPGIALPAFVVNESFPIVSLVGWFRPRLVVARSVLESCDREELAAVLAHEAGHNDRRDPWVRLLVRACPDLLSMTPWADRLERAWAEAAEQDADERAARTGPTRAMDLASALVKVTRLAGARKLPPIPVSALYRGEGIAGRIARLLERDPDSKGDSKHTSGLAAAVALMAMLLSIPAASVLGLHHRVHGVLEAVVAFLQ